MRTYKWLTYIVNILTFIVILQIIIKKPEYVTRDGTFLKFYILDIVTGTVMLVMGTCIICSFRQHLPTYYNKNWIYLYTITIVLSLPLIVVGLHRYEQVFFPIDFLYKWNSGFSYQWCIIYTILCFILPQWGQIFTLIWSQMYYKMSKKNRKKCRTSSFEETK